MSTAKIQRALISLSDKNGAVEFARALHEAGVEILSPGGTAARATVSPAPTSAIRSCRR